MSSNRRAIDRKPRRIRVRYGVNKLEKTAFSRNVSETGVFIGSNQVFAPGTTLQIEMQFPERTFTFWGRVVWAKKVPPQLAHVLQCGMGCYFIRTSDDWAEFFADWSGLGNGNADGRHDAPVRK